MKTDRFSDIIRRKLESIRPEFSEKDWARMQSSLQTGMPQPATPTPVQPFGGSLWAAKPWLMAAATVSAIVMVSFGFWQQREINQLRETVSQLKKPDSSRSAKSQPGRGTPEEEKITQKQREENGGAPALKTTSPASDGNSNRVHQQPRDTVYITRYVAVPSKSHVIPPNEEAYIDRPVAPSQQKEQRYAVTNRDQKAVNQANQSDNLTNNPNTNAYGESSTSSLTSENLTNNAVKSPQAANRLTRERKQRGQYANDREIALSGGSTAGSTYKKGNKVTGPGKGSTPNQTDYSLAPTESTPSESGNLLTSATIESINSLSLSMPSTNWTKMMALRAKRMRPARTTVVGGTESNQEPESQRVARTDLHFRAGVGGEVASKLTSAGVFTEVLLGKHWVMSAGVTQANYSGDKFGSDFDFDIRMRRDFRKEFAHGIDPRRDIFNIDTRTTRMLLPISVGYRVALSKTLSFVPTAGTYLTLSSTENATYLCPVPIPQRGFEQISVSDKRTVPLLNNLALSAGVEWQSGHWVLQSSPVLTIPVQTALQPFQPGQNWQSSTLMGLRARLLYQF